MKELYDIAVIGAGPSGSLCSMLTARAGLSTLLLEEHEAPGQFINCTGIIGAEAFRRLELPTEPILSSLQTITFYAPSGKSFRYDPGQPLAHVVSRLQFDQTLAGWAQEAGATLRTGYHARLLRVDSDAVELRQREDDPDPIRARAVVIATGFGSNLAQQAGLAGPREIVYGAQAEVEMDNLRDVEIYLGRAVAPEAFAWVVPLQPGIARVGLVAAKEAPVHFRKLLLHPSIAPRIRTAQPKMLLSPVPTEPIERSYTDRVLVVGEAAGQVKTTTQGGIYYGMLCAAMAAETLREAAQSDNFSAEALAPYEQAWTSAISQELKMGLSLRQLFARLSDNQIDALVELGTRDDIISLVKRLAQFDWHRDLIQTSLNLPALQEVVRGGLW
ncbi:MAG: NAD(P)/FAD-dependent oxidoreductase [Candidatus Omnitrophota bacterium]|nr:NAD(P)/FAD-dependent oxidoreductase [Candidatus Omnitrophota bacterium]